MSEHCFYEIGEYTLSSTVQMKFLETSKRYWGRTMSVDGHTDLKLTYGKAAIAAKLLSGKIKAATSSKYVSILLPPCNGNIIASFGTYFSGKIPVMINYSMGALKNLDLAKKKCGTDLVLTSRKLIEKLGIEATDEMIFLDEFPKMFSVFEKISSLLSVKFLTNDKFAKNCGWKEDGDDVCVILFTSGSEKEPKAVQLTHNNVLFNIDAVRTHLSLGNDNVMLGSLPVFHSFGFLLSFLSVITATEIVFYPNPLDYKTIGEVAEKYKVTTMLGTPTFYEGYIAKCKKSNFASVKLAISGGDKLLTKTRERFLEKFGINILEGYGVTECTAGATLNNLENSKPGTVGKPMPGVEIKIVNAATNEELGVNQEGMILIRGGNLTPGYLGDSKKTNEAIKGSWYYTGDIGKLDEDGFLHFLGRLRRFVKIGGEMVSLPLVEAAVSECIPDNDCAVVGIRDDKRGSRIIAFVTCEKESIPAIKAELRKTLPQISIPKEFRVIQEIPKLGSGKSDFRKLIKIAETKASAQKSNT